MLTTIEGVYKDGNITLAEIPVGMEEAQVLVTFLPKAAPRAHPQVLYGAWGSKMPVDLNIEEALKEIRGEWSEEQEIGKNE